MQEKNTAKVKRIFAELKNHYKCRTYGELADILGVRPSTMSAWFNRGSFDEDKVFRICKGISYDWLLTGEGPMFTEQRPRFCEG